MDALRRHPWLASFLAYLALAVVATWPLVARFGTAVLGGGAGAWRTVWAFWWWGESVGRHASPFFSDALRWPAGAALPVHVAQLPSALAVLPFWPLTPAIPEVSLYNGVVLVSYPLAGLATCLVARELWGGELGPFLAGAIYTIGVLHSGATGHPDVSMWPPLYFLGLARTVRRHGPGAPLLAGAALALAALTAPAHLVACLAGTVVLLAWWWRTERAVLASPAFARRLGLVLVSFGALAGWACARAAGAGVGAAQKRGADLLSFLVPGAGSAWTSAVAPPRAAPGVLAPTTYVGWVVLALTVIAAMRAKASRAWVAVALAGLVLALGPHLRVGGVDLPWVLLPLGWIGAAGPRAGIDPAHFGWLVTFGLAVAGAAVLAQLVRDHRRGALVASAVTLLALVEAWPRSPPTSSWPAPRFLRDLARDGERWAVLDASGPERQLWNQVLHRHPQLGGAIEDGGRGVPGPAATGSAVVDALLDRAGPRAGVLSAPGQRQEALRALQQRNVRFVIVDDETLAAARALRLPRAYAGEGLVVFEVPPGAG